MRKWISATLIIIMLANVFPVDVYAARNVSKDESIRNTTYNTSIMLKDVLNDQYDMTISEIKELIVEKNYDFSLTMEGIYHQQSLLSNVDIIEYMAAYMSCKKYAEEKRKSIPRIYEIPFIRYTVEEVPFEEYIPTKVDEYLLSDKGHRNYIQYGYKYVFEPTQVPVYELIGNGIYKDTGEVKLIEPELRKNVYIDVQLSMITPEEIFEFYGIDKSSINEDYLSRVDQIYRMSSNNGLNQSINLVFPEEYTDTIDLEEYESYLQGVPQIRKVIVRTALSLLGKIPYEWGGKSRQDGYDTFWWTFNPDNGLQRGLDCSGFVQWVYRTSGFPKETFIELGSTSQILKGNLKRINKDELLPGDVGVTNRPKGSINHTGIYLGDDKWIHCTASKNTVVVSEFAFTQFYRPIDMPGKVNTKVNQLYTEEYNKLFNNSNTYNILQYVDNKKTADYTYAWTSEDIQYLAEYMYEMAKGDGLNSWVALGELVMNRVVSPKYPDTVEGVLFDGNGLFSRDKSLQAEPTDEMLRLAELVLKGRIKVLNDVDLVNFQYRASEEELDSYNSSVTVEKFTFYANEE